MARDVLLGEHGAHAVAEQRSRRVWVLASDVVVQFPGVLDDAVPAAGTENAQPIGTRGETMASMVVGVDGVAFLVETAGQRVIAAGMFAHPMGDLHCPPNVSLGKPAVVVDLGAVADGELGLLHVRRCLPCAADDPPRWRPRPGREAC